MGESRRRRAGLPPRQHPQPHRFPEPADVTARDLRRAIEWHRDDELPALARQSLYLAMHHPVHGAPMRDGLSLGIRRGGTAHVTVHFSNAGLAFALNAGFVDLTSAIASTPDNEQSIAIHDHAAGTPEVLQ